MRRPRVGDVVELDWLDSGLDTTGTADGSRPGSLVVSTCYGRVVWMGEDPKLKVPKWVDRTTLWLVHDGAGPDDTRSHLAAVWWPAVVRLVVLRRGD